MQQTDLTETEWQYTTNVLSLQRKKRKHELQIIWNAIFLKATYRTANFLFPIIGFQQTFISTIART